MSKSAPITPQPLGFAESLRQRFESLRRQTRLAPDVNCFQPNGKLASVRFIAHPHGLHVTRWLQVLSHTQAKVTIETPAAAPTFSNDFVSAQSIVPNNWKIPLSIRYVLSGLLLRFFGKQGSQGVTHAHSASGNGLVAWLSGQPYLIGTYGSEIYEADQRGFAYRWLLKRILHGAERIHNALPGNNTILTNKFGIPPEKIYSFHLGYDEKCFCRIDRTKRIQMREAAGLVTDGPVWVICRRTHPHYRTQEAVLGFLEYCQRGGNGNLVLLCGDHQHSYTDAISKLASHHEFGHRIKIIEQMLNPPEFASWLQIADFSISVPKTDNFSNAILETMGCAAVPVLANLKSYDDVRSCRSIRWMDCFEPQDFTAMFNETSQSVPETIENERNDCFQFAQSLFSTEHAIRILAAFYLGQPLPKAATQRSEHSARAA